MTDAAFCASCGAARPAGASFCAKCGKAYDARPAPAAPERALSLPALAVIVAGILVAVGAVMPWVTAGSGVFQASRSGFDMGDGFIAIICGVALILLGVGHLMTAERGRYRVGPLVVAIIALLLGAWDAYQVLSAPPFVSGGITIERSVGVGLWLVLVGAVVGIAGGWQLRSEIELPGAAGIPSYPRGPRKPDPTDLTPRNNPWQDD